MHIFQRLFRRTFPKPSKAIMTLEELARYWNSLSPRWQKQCKVYVYRIRKSAVQVKDRMVEIDGKPNFWQPVMDPENFGIRPCTAFVPSATQIGAYLGRRGESKDPYTVRIVREWETQPGMNKKEEICIANFELTLETVV